MSHYGGVTGASGTHIVRSSDFNSIDYPVDFGYMRDANVQIGGSDAYGNTFSNVGFGVNAMNVVRSQVNISHNTIQFPYGAGILLRQGTMNIPNQFTSYLVEKNHLTTTGWVDGTVFVDFGILFSGQKTMDILYRYNNIHMQDANWGGVWAIGMKDARIERNRVWGQGLAGIYFDAGFDNEIIDNNLLSADVGMAHVWLLSQTANNVVSGRSNGTILDWGVNNTTSGEMLTTSGAESSLNLERYTTDNGNLFERMLE